MGQILRLIAYLAVIGIGAFIARSRGRRRRIAIASLFLYVGGLHAAVLLASKEAWPFSNYQILHGRASIDVNLWRIDFVGVDRLGREWILDPWAFDSVYRLPLQFWAASYSKALPPADQQRALAWMLNAAEKSRERSSSGNRVGAARLLGRFAMPDRYGLKRETAISTSPFAGLRLYYVEWTTRRRIEHRWLFEEYAAR